MRQSWLTITSQILEKQCDTNHFHGPMFYQMIIHFGRNDRDTHE